MIIKFEIDTDALLEHFVSSIVETFMPIVKEGVTEQDLINHVTPKAREYFENLNRNEVERLIMTGIADTMFPRKDESHE